MTQGQNALLAQIEHSTLSFILTLSNQALAFIFIRKLFF